MKITAWLQDTTMCGSVLKGRVAAQGRLRTTAVKQTANVCRSSSHCGSSLPTGHASSQARLICIV